jgi:hypothetical protein
MRRAPQTRCADGERGFLTVQYALAVGLSFVMLLLVANLLVDLYARAAVRDALEEGTRAAVPADARADACATRAREVLQGLLRGPIGRDVEVGCVGTAELISATARVRLASWLPGLAPDWRFTVHATATPDR